LSLATVIPPLVTTYQNKLETYFGHTCHIYGAAAPSSTHCALYSFIRLPFWRPLGLGTRLNQLVWK